MTLNKNIIAIEGEWDNNLKKKETIKSTVTLLHEVCDIDYIFRKVNTIESLINYIEITAQNRYRNYGIIVLAFHGNRYEVEVSKENYISIDELAKRCKGLFKSKLVHFSACSIVTNSNTIKNFKKITGAKMVSGYTKQVDFLESSVFDIVLLNKLNEFKRIGDVDNHLLKKHRFLYDSLGFKMIKG